MQIPLLMQLVLLGLAGALGAVARYLLGFFVAQRLATKIPVGTLIINVSGAFVIGVLFALASRSIVSSVLQTILATGFLGGYTTFSTMSWESVQLVRGGLLSSSVLYLAASLVLGLCAASAGLVVGWRV
jgi:CrcB protein